MRLTDQYIWNFLFALFFFSMVVSGAVILQSVGERPLVEPGLMEFLLLSFATLRLTRLFVNDVITAFFREQFFDVVEYKTKRVLEKPDSGPRRTLADLLTCPWCFGMWAGATVVFFYYLTTWSFFPILILAVSGAGSVLQLIANMIGWRAEYLKREAGE